MLAMGLPAVIWQCLGTLWLSPWGRASWVESGTLLRHYSDGAKVEEKQWLLYKRKAHAGFRFLRGSGGLRQEGTVGTEEAASRHQRQKEPSHKPELSQRPCWQ